MDLDEEEAYEVEYLINNIIYILNNFDDPDSIMNMTPDNYVISFMQNYYSYENNIQYTYDYFDDWDPDDISLFKEQIELVISSFNKRRRTG